MRDNERREGPLLDRPLHLGHHLLPRKGHCGANTSHADRHSADQPSEPKMSQRARSSRHAERQIWAARYAGDPMMNSPSTVSTPHVSVPKASFAGS